MAGAPRASSPSAPMASSIYTTLAANIPYSDRFRPGMPWWSPTSTAAGGLDAALGEPAKGPDSCWTNTLAVPHATITEPAQDGASVPSGYAPVLGERLARRQSLSKHEERAERLAAGPGHKRPLAGARFPARRPAPLHSSWFAPWTPKNTSSTLTARQVVTPWSATPLPTTTATTARPTSRCRSICGPPRRPSSAQPARTDIEAMASGPTAYSRRHDERLGTIDPATGALTHGPGVWQQTWLQGRQRASRDVQGPASTRPPGKPLRYRPPRQSQQARPALPG